MESYYTLLERVDGVWGVHFGDYDLEAVQDEREDRRDHGVKAKDLKIIRTGRRQFAVDAAVSALNAKTGG